MIEEKTEEKIRCFVAIDIPREAIKEVEKIQGEIKSKNLVIGNFTEGENLHLTLKFLGEIDENKLNNLKKKLKEIKFKKFLAYFGELGVFNQSFIRIIWIHILGKQILDLQREVDKKLEELFQKEERFMSHLTIARVKHVKDKVLFLAELKKINVQNLNFEVSSFYLIKSELKPDGPVYTILEEFKLE